MARFQALTNNVLDEQLAALREEMGLKESQKAELLREIALLASWVVSQARAGRVIEAHGADGVQVLHHPMLDRNAPLPRIVLSPEEADRLVELLERPPQPSTRVAARLSRNQPAPKLRWPDP